MRHFIIVFGILIASSFYVNAQVRVEGVVRDSIGAPLELANVIAINQATKAMQGYAITNLEGQYKINVEPNTIYTLMVSYIGMRTDQ